MPILNNLTGKIASKADLLGKLYGYLGPMHSFAQAAGKDSIDSIISEHEEALNALLAGKIPKISNVINQFAKSEHHRSVLKNALIAYIVGDLGILKSNQSNALKKFAENAIKYSALSAAVEVWDWNPHPPANVSWSSKSPSSNYQGYGY